MMNKKILLAVVGVVSASFLVLPPLTHAQTDPNKPFSVAPGGTCIKTSDCDQAGSSSELCLPSAPGSSTGKCQTTDQYMQSLSGGAQPASAVQPPPPPAQTQTVQQSSPAGGSWVNQLNVSDLQSLLKEVLGYVTELGSIFLVLMLVYVGFLFVSARGNDEKIRSARTALMWTVVGGLLLLGASAIATVIANTAASL